ncbi:MAG: SDR family oxidoreductase [Candidatus Aenigmarchaeota archaeon]|nr:SDR family oxidoreductase [Candidatus Aenigmarchaeota archaeon]
MRCLVIGSTGLVGKAVYNAFREEGMETYGTFLKQSEGNFLRADIRDRKSLEDAFAKSRPDVAVLTAALTWVDYCEKNRQEAWEINVEGMRNVADICKKYGSAIVFMSSDYVFDGANGPYRESDATNPVNFYGKTKLEGESIVRTIEKHLIIRTTVVFDYGEPKNFVSRLIEQNSKGIAVRAPNDQYGNPTLASNLAEAILELVLKQKTGIYNVAGQSWLTRYDFSMLLAKKLGLDDSLITGVTTEELGQEAARPKKGGLIVEKAQKEIKTRLLDVNEAIDIFSGRMREGRI